MLHFAKLAIPNDTPGCAAVDDCAPWFSVKVEARFVTGTTCESVSPLVTAVRALGNVPVVSAAWRNHFGQ